MKHSMTRITSFLLALVMLFSVAAFPVSAAPVYDDVPADAWYAQAVEYVSEKGIMDGVARGVFDPEGRVTRAMFVTVLARLAKVKTNDSVSAFADVPADEWYSGAIAWAAENGIVNGVSASEFAPNRSISRQDMCTILARFASAMKYDLPQTQNVTFTDAKAISKYAREAVATCASAGLIGGFEDGTFKPKGTTTRAQIAAVMMRLDLALDGQIVEPVPMPAQEFSGEAGEGMTVSVNAPAGALPEKTDMSVSRVTDEAALAALAQKVGVDVFAAADISFVKDGAELEPEKAVEVQIAVDGIENIENPVVAHIKDNGTVEYVFETELVAVTRGGDKALRFYASDFSVYAIFDGSDISNKTLTVVFHDGNNVINTQIIRQDQIDRYETGADGYKPIFDPGVPALGENQSFEGWLLNKANYTSEDVPNGYDIEHLNAYVKATYGSEGTIALSATATTTIHLYAMTFNVRYLIYHDQAGAVLKTQSYHIATNATSGSALVNMPYVGFKGSQNFVGWIVEDYIEVMGDYPLYSDDVEEATVYHNNTTYSNLSDTLQLYPYLNTGNWLVFDTYKDQDDDPTSTTFIAPVFYEEGQNTAAPAKPERVGYTFEGWYKDKQFTERFVFGSPIAEKTTVYAKWSPKQTTYTVVFWQQKNTDTPTTENADKQYDYYSHVTRTATTGQTVSIQTATTGETADNRLAYNSNSSIGEMGYYFLYNETNSAEAVTGEKVKGDGSTVLNVYYDRKVITFKFYESDKTTLWTPTGGYVPAENGDYYYFEETNATGYYLIGTGPNASYAPANGDTVYYYFTYSESGYYALPTYDNFTKYRASLSNYGGSHTYNDSSNTYYVFTDHQETRIWYVSGNNYPYRPLFYRYTAQQSGYYPVGTGPDPEATGTHNLSGGVGSNTISGLYGAPLNSIDWPNSGSGYVWANDEGSSTFYYPLALTEYVPVSANTVEMKFYLTSDSGRAMHIYYVGQDLDDSNSFTTPLTDGENIVGSNGATWYPNETIHGFKVAKYRFGTTGSWTNCTEETAITISYNSSDLYVAFVRNTHSLSFVSNNIDITPDNLPTGVDLNAVPFDTSFAAFQSARPQNTPEGYYFDGWYADPSCDTEFNFEGTMPDNNVRIYAKWTQIRFRVVCDPRGGDTSINPSDIVIPNGQATAFRVDYGEVIEGTNLNNATREGFNLLGWYLDTDPDNDTVFDTPFEFSTPMTDHDGMADMTYIDADDADRQGTDPWKDNAEYSDVGRDNVRGKITIYAKWREDPDGIIGVNVRYDAVEGETPNSGYFNTSPRTYIKDDPDIYADGAEAYCQPASTPYNSGEYQFLYWEILGRDGQPTGRKAYPGQTWEVLFSDAVEEAINNSNPNYLTYPEKSESLNVKPLVRGTNRGPSSYKRVTTLTPGKFYLIAYVSGNTAYLMGNNYYDTSNNASPKCVSATVSNDTITGLYADYQFGVEENSGYYRFGSHYYMQYLNIKYESGWMSSTGYLNFGSDSYDGTPNTWWSYSNNRLVNYNTSISNSYRYVRFNGSNNNNRRFELSSSGNANQITFFELQEPEITGVEFKIATDLKVGDKYVIAIDNRAVGNRAVSGDYFINSIQVTHNTTGTESVIVDETDVDAVIWQIESGNATDGYVLKNLSNGKYLGLSADGKCYLSPSDTPLAWTYDNGTDLNNHVTDNNNQNSSGQYYYYLNYSSTFNDFTTTVATGNNVKFYKATNTYTVTFKDGRTNEVIATQEVEEGASATAPAAPDHTDTGWIFSGWSTPFDNVTADIEVVAQYVDASTLSYTVTFNYMTKNGEWKAVSVPVNHGDPAVFPADAEHPDPTEEANWPSGYRFNSWDKKFDNVTSNLTVNAVYKQVATKKYVVTLRAVYGRNNATALTHIYWYANNGTDANNGAGVRQEDNDLELNKGYAIPTTVTFRSNEGLSWPGHTFLGWARLENEDATGESTKAHPELTEEDLYLKWVTDHYEVNKNYGKRDLEPEWVTVDKVAADEEHPYHDMYAVWYTPRFFVYHSSTGLLEAIEMPVKYNGSGANAGQFTADTFDITSLVADGYLYGGYYLSYGGVNTDAVDALAAAYKAPGKDSWTAAVHTDRGQVAAFNTDVTTVTVGETEYELQFAEYTGDSRKNGTKYFWESANVCRDNGKTTFTPTAGEVYYLKEVPDDYLTLKYVYIYDELDVDDSGDFKIKEFFQFTLVDDNLYNSIGFRMKTDSESMKDVMAQTVTPKQYLSKSYTITQKDRDDGTPGVSLKVDAEYFLGSGRGGYVATLKNNEACGTSFAVVPTWVTKDGVTVANAPQKLVVPQWQDKDDLTNKVQSTPLAGFIGTEKLYVNTSAIGFWQDANAITRLYFFGDGDAWIETVKVKDNVYVCTVPAGNWTGVNVVRCNPAVSTVGWDAKWNQSQDVSLDHTNNLITLIDWIDYGKYQAKKGVYNP